MAVDLEWEKLFSYTPGTKITYPSDVSRAKVPGGWLVFAMLVTSPVMTFVPDPSHSWAKQS
jgi:hypothetical protein